MGPLRRRNTAEPVSDDASDMPIYELDDATADALLSGRYPLSPGARDHADTLDELGDLVATIRDAGSPRPRPHALLSEVLEHGVVALEPRSDPWACGDTTGCEDTTSAAEPEATHGPASDDREVPPPEGGLRSKPRARELVAARLAAIGLAAKFGAGSVAVLAATAGAGTAGALPGPLQERFDTVAPIEAPATVPGDELPPTASATTGDAEAEHRSSAGDSRDREGAGIAGPEVADEARSDGPGVDGRTIASEASEQRSERGQQRAEQARETADERRPAHASERPRGARPPATSDDARATDSPPPDHGPEGNPGGGDDVGTAGNPGAAGGPGTSGPAEGSGQQDRAASEDPPPRQGSEEDTREEDPRQDDPDEESEESEEAEEAEESGRSEQPPEQAPGSDTRP